MSPFTYFTFHEQLYPSRKIVLSDGNGIIVATTRLNGALFTADGQYVSEQTGHLDDLICFFVDDVQNGWDDSRLATLVEADILGVV